MDQVTIHCGVRNAFSLTPSTAARIAARILDSEIPTGPMRLSSSADGYTTVTLPLIPVVHEEQVYTVLMQPTNEAPTASELLQSINLEVPAPPAWLKVRAISAKLDRKVKWLYPPLDRYADANEDGIIDAADLVAVLDESAK